MLSRWLGLGLFAGGPAAAWIVLSLPSPPEAVPPDWLANLVEAAAGFGAALLLFGGIMRPIHRWMWHNTLRHSVLYSGYIPKVYATGWASPFWRPWLHIDREGNDLDARN